MNKFIGRVGGLFLAAQFFLNTCLMNGACAQQADLDLSSTTASVQASSQGSFTNATLQVSDGTSLNLTQESMLTAAQALALSQVLNGGQQSLQINAAGQAVGGSFALTNQMAQSMSSLNIPQNVTAVQDFGVLSNLNLTGNFVNSGNFYAISSNVANTTANISAANILNQQGALLSSVLPSAGLSSLGLSGLTSAVSNLSLNLTAINNIINSGAIYSAGNLTASAGGSIINALPAGVTGISPVMQAMQNVNMIANNIANSGIINSQLANINIASMMASNLLINNIGGRIEALTGAINVRDQLFTTKHDLNILGGDLISQELNLFSGDGVVNMNVREVTGLINVNAGVAHLQAATPLMQIGNISLTGDPTFYNSLGDLSVGDLNFSGQDLALVASGNIVVNGAITTSGAAGGDVLVFAGAKFEDDFSGSQLPDEPYQSSTIRVIGVLEGRTISIFDTNGISIDSTGSGGDGGNVTLVADGHISVANRIVTTGAENSGNVTVISKTGINVKDIDTSGNLPPGGITTGNISLLTYQPSINSGILEVTNGTIINSGGFDTTSRGLVSANGTIAADDLKTSGGSIFLRAGDTIEVDNLRASSPDFGGFISIEAHQVTDSASPFIVGASATDDGIKGVIESTGAFGGSLSISSDATGGITIESWNNITVAASGGVGGEISVSANNGPLNIGGGTIDLNGVGSGGGEFSLQSASTLTITNNLVVNANGDDDNSGGDVNIQAAALNLQGSLTTNLNSSGSGDGGDISVDGIGGTLQITGPGSLTINANAGNDGAGGIIEVEANFNMGGDLTLKADGGMFGGEITVDTNILTAGNITITADQGVTEAFRSFGGEIDITNNNSGDISITTGALILSANTVDHTAGDIIIEAANLNIDAGSISVGASATGNGNGGFVSLAVDKFTATSVISLSANGGGTGFGGEVDVYTYGADGDITVGSGAGQVQVSATGGSEGSESGDGGFAVFSSGRDLTVNPSAINATPLGENGAGAWITLASSTASDDGELKVLASISANGKGSGAGGKIELISDAKDKDLVVDGTIANGIIISATGGSAQSLSGSGGTIIISSARGLKVDSSQIKVDALGINGDGGTIQLKSGFRNAGNLQIIGELKADGVGTGSGGTIDLSSLSTTADMIIGGPIGIKISATSISSGEAVTNGGTLRVHATGDILLNSDGVHLGAVPQSGVSSVSGNGGTIEIQSDSGVVTIEEDIDVSGVGSGKGGTVVITAHEIGGFAFVTASGGATNTGGVISLKSLADMIVSGHLFLIADAGIGNGQDHNGGTVNVEAFGNLEIGNLVSMSASTKDGSGNGGEITLRAGTDNSEGALVVLGKLTADGFGSGNGGAISLISSGDTKITVDGQLSASAQSQERAGLITFSNVNGVSLEVNIAGALQSDTQIPAVIQLGSPTSASKPAVLSLQSAGTFNGSASNKELQGPLSVYGTSIQILSSVNQDLSFNTVLANSGNVDIKLDGSSSAMRLELSTSSIKATAGDILIRLTGTEKATVVVEHQDALIEASGSLTINAAHISNSGTMTSKGGLVALTNLGIDYPSGSESKLTVFNHKDIKSLVGENELGEINFSAHGSKLEVRSSGELHGTIEAVAQAIDFRYSKNSTLKLTHIHALGGDASEAGGALSIIYEGPETQPSEIVIMSNALILTPGALNLQASSLTNQGSIDGGNIVIGAPTNVTNEREIISTKQIVIFGSTVLNNGMIRVDPARTTTLSRSPDDGAIILGAQNTLTLTNNGTISSLNPILFANFPHIIMAADIILLQGSGTFSGGLVNIEADTSITFQGSLAFNRPIAMNTLGQVITMAQVIAPTITIEANRTVAFMQLNPNTNISAPVIFKTNVLQNDGEVRTNQAFAIQPASSGIVVTGTGTILAASINAGGSNANISQGRISSIDGLAGFLSVEALNEVIVSVGGGDLKIRNILAKEQSIFLQNRDAANGTISFEQKSSIVTRCMACDIYTIVGTVEELIAAPSNLPSELVVSGLNNEFFLGHGLQFTGSNNKIIFPLEAHGRIIFVSSANKITLGGNVTFKLEDPNLPMVFDMSNPAGAQQIAGLQNLGILGGNLNIAVDGSVSGTVIASSSNVSSISELWVPNDVTVFFEDYSSSNPLQIESAVNPILYIGGSVNLSNNFGQGSSIEISSANAPTLMVASTGTISSSTSLSISLPSLSNDGSIAVSGSLVITSQSGLQLGGTGAISASSTNVTLGTADVPISLISSHQSVDGSVILRGSTVTIGNSSSLEATGSLMVETSLLSNSGILEGGGKTTITSNSTTLVLSGNGELISHGDMVAIYSTYGVSIQGQQSIDAGSIGAFGVNFDPYTSTSIIADIAFAEDSSLTLTAGDIAYFSAGNMTFGDNVSISTASNATIEWYSDTSPKILTIADGATVNFNTNGGFYDFDTFSRTSISFLKAAGSGTSAVNFNGGQVTTYTGAGGTVTIGSGVVLSSDKSITFNIHNGGTFLNNGTVSSSVNSGSITVDAFAYPITLVGSGNIELSGNNSSFRVNTAGTGTVTVNDNLNIDFTGSNGSVGFTAHTLNLSDGVSINASGGSDFNFTGNTLNLGSESSINAANASGAAININAGNVNLPADSFATMSSSGGSINFVSQELNFSKSGGSVSTLNLLGGQLVTSTSGDTTIDTGVTLASNNDISMQIFGGSNLILNGSITTSKNAATVLVTSSPTISFSGATASISATGGGGSTITIIGFDNGLTVDSSYSLNAGSDGIVTLLAPDGAINIASGVTLSVDGGSELVIGTSLIDMAAGSKIYIARTTGNAVTWVTQAARSLKLSGPTGSSATIETGGGTISITGNGHGPMTFARSSGSGEATLNLNGGDALLTAENTTMTIETGVTVASDKDILITLNNSTFSNQGTLGLTSGGTLSIAADAASGAINIGAVSINNGSLSVTALSDITIDSPITITGSGTLNIETLTGSNADIIINASIGGGATTTISADGSGSIVQTTGVISGTTIDLSSGSGDIGTSSNELTTNAEFLTANTSGVGDVYIFNNSSVDVGDSSAGDTFSLIAYGDIKTSGIVSADDVILEAAPGSGGSVFADPDIIGTTSIYIKADGSGAITQLPGIKLIAPTVILESQDGDIGTSTTPIETVADNLIVNTGAAASAYIKEQDNILLEASSVGQTFRLRAGGNITVIGNVQANEVKLRAAGSTSAIIVQANISATTKIDLRTTDSGNITVDTNKSLTSSSVILRGNDLKLDGTIDAGSGQVSLRANGNKTMALADTADGNGNDATFDINSSELQNITAATLIIGALTNTESLTLQNNIDVSNTGAGNYNLTLRTGSNLSTTGQTITLGDKNLTIDTNGNLNSGSINSTSGTVHLKAGSLVAEGVISAQSNITLVTKTGTNGSITLGANITTTGNITFTADGSGTISQTSGLLSGNHLNFTSGSGDIGSITHPIETSATKITANTSGSVYIHEQDGLILGNSSAGSNFSVVAEGAVTTHDITTLNGSILVSAGSGTLTVAGTSIIFANEGNVHLQNRNTTSGAIVIGVDSIIGAYSESNTSLGNVYITIGDIPSAPTTGSTPSKISVNNVNAGHVYFDTTSITAQGTTSTINVDGRTVLFETGGLGANSIKLKGDVTITAGVPYNPIAFTHNVPESAAVSKVVPKSSQSFSVPLWTRNKSVELSEDSPGNFKLTKGEILVAPTHNCRLIAGEYEIDVAAGTICLIEFNNEVLVLKNLHATHARSVYVQTKDQLFTLGTARELILGTSSESTQNKLLSHQIGRRHISTARAGKLYCIRSEFSTISIMQNSRLVSKVINTNIKSSRGVRERIIKTTACLMSLPSNKEAFKRN